MFKFLRIGLLSAGALFAFGAMAQPGPDDDDSQTASADQPDPPSRVGRLSFIRGAVSFVPAGENDWVEAQINRPLITGDKLWTDHDSRAELEIGSSAVRIDEQTSFDFLNLDDQTAQVELTQGSLNLRVRRLYDNQVYEIDTPTLAFVVNRVGEFRVTVSPDGQATTVSVLHGGGDAYGENDARARIEEGQSVTFNDSALRDYSTDSLPPPDAFDEFIADRDQRWDGARSRQYVSEDVIGYQDLDDNGDWNDVPEYGHVWYPTTVAVGWTPYHYGHWGWVGAYGWTWIDDAPWGFAPFHYGRWAYIGNRWGWCPGPVAVRAYYAPALVAFIGGGVSIGVGGPVGWFPLGPRDVWFPGYRTSRGYFTNVNISNSVFERGAIDGYYGHYRRGDINYNEVNYHNRLIAGAVIAVPAAAFIGARAVHSAAIAVNRETFANAHVSAFAAVAPTRASLVASDRRVGRAPPEAAFNRRIVAASKPPAPVASFATREALLKKNPGQPLNNVQLRSLPAVQNGARNVSVNEHNNIKVVTNNGVPAHTAAAPLVARPAGNGNARRGVGNGLQNNGTVTDNGGQDKKFKAEDRRGGGNAIDTSHGAGNATANGNGRPAVVNGAVQDQHLQSSRFAHGTSGATGNNNGQQNGNDKNGQVNDRGRLIRNDVKQSGNSIQTTNAAQQATGNGQGNGQSGNGGNGQVNGRGVGRDRQVHTNQADSVSGNGQAQSNAQHSNARAYRAPAEVHGNNDHQGQNQQQQLQLQQQQVQQQPHVQQQILQPRVQQPVQQQQPHNQGQGQGQGNNNRGGDNKHNKKDDDKKGGGGG